MFRDQLTNYNAFVFSAALVLTMVFGVRWFLIAAVSFAKGGRGAGEGWD